MKVDIQFSPALELLNSLDVFLKNQFKKSDFSKSWIKSVTKDLTPALFKQLRDEENIHHLSLLKLLTATHVKQLNDLPDFFLWLDRVQCDKEELSPFVMDEFELNIPLLFGISSIQLKAGMNSTLHIQSHIF
jgi:hypothetical protein